jgi:hypothetical protein
VTDRMLEMFKKRPTPQAEASEDGAGAGKPEDES